jgi:hypothetical protein
LGNPEVDDILKMARADLNNRGFRAYMTPVLVSKARIVKVPEPDRDVGVKRRAIESFSFFFSLSLPARHLPGTVTLQFYYPWDGFTPTNITHLR